MMFILKYCIFTLGLLFSIKAYAIQEITIAPMQEFSGLSRAEILNKRTQAVKNSIFDYDNPYYTPDSQVFQIEDNLPWISAHDITCYGKGVSGLSRESFAILNPAILYYPSMDAFNFSQIRGCSEVDYLLVNKLTYDESQKIITAHIDYSSFYRKNKNFYNIQLCDANAHDFGYHYTTVSDVKNIQFKYNENILNTVLKTKGFYHRGGSCGEPGGCNNYSPFQPELEFYITKLPAHINFKLWKNNPYYKEDPSDIEYHLIFD